MISSVDKIREIKLSNGYELTEISEDEEIIRGELKVKNDELNYDNPYGITLLFEDELNKINTIPEIEDVEISNVITKHYEDATYEYIVKFIAFMD